MSTKTLLNLLTWSVSMLALYGVINILSIVTSGIKIRFSLYSCYLLHIDLLVPIKEIKILRTLACPYAKISEFLEELYPTFRS